MRVKDVFKIYAGETKKFPGLFALVFLGAIGIQVADIVGPLYLREFFNTLAGGATDPLVIGTLLTLIGIIATASFAEWLSRRIQVYSLILLEARVMTGLYASSFFYLISHSHHFFINHFGGTLTRRVSKFAHAFETVFDGVMLQFFPTAVFAVSAVGILFQRNHLLGITLGIWVLLFVLFQLFVARLRQPLRIARADADSRMVGTLADAVANQNTITLFSGTTYEHSIFKGVVDFWHKATMRAWKADEHIWSALGFFMILINVAMLYGAMLLWQQGLLTIGDFALIQTYLLGLFQRLTRINQEIRRFYDAFADASEMVDILNTPHDIQDQPNAAKLAPEKSQIVFSDVDFRFYENRSILQDFNLVIQGGEKLALVGPSGAGKSTVTKLLLRMYDVKGGSIKIDGQNIAEVTQDSLRDAIAFVPQEPILFHRTLMENIRYGRREATDKEVIEAAKKAHCHEFVSSLPDQYETYVGERGVKLSGGERQRVAIARAILKNAPILVLDEATSSLDSESESLIQDALRVLMEGKTVIVIAHRLSTIMKMDRIVVIDNGKVVASGSHEELLKQEGLYEKLWSIQAGGFLASDSTLEKEEGIEEDEAEELEEKEG